MKGDKIPSTHSRAKMDMRYNEPSNEIEKRKQKRQARRENRRYLKEELKKGMHLTHKLAPVQKQIKQENTK